MSFVSLVFLLGTLSWALPVPFSVTLPIDKNASKNTTQSTIISDLKMKAVKEWLLRFVGVKRYQALEAGLKSEWVDRLFVHYHLAKQPVKSVWELSGKLDNDALKRWVWLTEARSGNHVLTPRPCLVATSEQPEFSWDKPKRELAEKHLVRVVLRYQSRLVPTEVQNTIPPRSSSEMEAFGDTMRSQGWNSCFWLHLRPCSQCGLGTLESIIFTASPPRHAFTRATDITSTEPNSFSTVLDTVATHLQGGLEELIGSGRFVGSRVTVRIVGVDAFSKFRRVGDWLGSLDPIIDVTPEAMEKGMVDFRVTSQVPAADLYQAMGSSVTNELPIKPETVENNLITARLK